MNNSIGNSIGSFIHSLRRFHLTLFIVTIVGGLIVAILILNTILNQSSGDNGNTPGVGGAASFDQATIDRLNKLKTSTESSGNQALPSGRINPFSE